MGSDKQSNKTAWKYILSFVLMLLLTGIAFYTVMSHSIETPFVKILVIGLAVIQILLQLYIFMHLNSKKQWVRLLMLTGGFFVGVVTIIFLILSS